MKITDKYIFFWGGIYSQWYRSIFVVDSIEYQCAEQYMMAEKARTFGDEVNLQKILSVDDPKKQKKWGRTVKNYDDDIWSRVRFDVVVRGNYAKFSQNEYLKKQLLATGDKIIVEASPYDKIWGIGLSEYDERCLYEAYWKGQNLLGKAIMKVRDMLREEDK